jgi:hypothetical protein
VPFRSPGCSTSAPRIRAGNEAVKGFSDHCANSGAERLLHTQSKAAASSTPRPRAPGRSNFWTPGVSYARRVNTPSKGTGQLTRGHVCPFEAPVSTEPNRGAPRLCRACPVRSRGGLGGAHRSERLLHDFRNRVFRDAACSAVARLDPFSERLGSFARITRNAASGDVLTSDDGCLVDHVFPRGGSLAWATSRDALDHLDAAVDARPVPSPYFLFEPLRDAPGVHWVTGGSLAERP